MNDARFAMALPMVMMTGTEWSTCRIVALKLRSPRLLDA